MSGTCEIFDQKPNTKTIEDALDSCFGGKNSIYVVTFSFFFPIETKYVTSCPQNKENKAVPSGQGRNQEIPPVQGSGAAQSRNWARSAYLASHTDLRHVNLRCAELSLEN